MSDTLLKLEGVHTHIGAYHILHGVNLTVPRGAPSVRPAPCSPAPSGR